MLSYTPLLRQGLVKLPSCPGWGALGRTFYSVFFLHSNHHLCFTRKSLAVVMELLLSCSLFHPRCLRNNSRADCQEDEHIHSQASLNSRQVLRSVPLGSFVLL